MTSDELDVFIEYIRTYKPSIDGVIQPVTVGCTIRGQSTIYIGKESISFKHDIISLDQAIEEYKSQINVPGELDLIK
jgi:hypothetical protein